jgi:hypothetical protein
MQRRNGRRKTTEGLNATRKGKLGRRQRCESRNCGEVETKYRTRKEKRELRRRKYERK